MVKPGDLMLVCGSKGPSVATALHQIIDDIRLEWFAWLRKGDLVVVLTRPRYIASGFAFKRKYVMIMTAKGMTGWVHTQGLIGTDEARRLDGG